MKARKLRKRGASIYALCLAANAASGIVVRFNGLQSGVVVECKDGYYPIGYYLSRWPPHSDARTWRYLPDYEEKKLTL